MKVNLGSIRRLNEHYKTGGDILAVGTDKLVEIIGAQLGGVDEVIEFGSKYQDALIVKVVSCLKHPNADKLSLCRIDDGSVAKDVERGDDGLVQVVCGAPNVRAGMVAIWLPPGATVPETHGKDPFVLEAREIRGQTSNGMLASPKELAVGDGHDGILEINYDYQPGLSFAETFIFNDVVIDIENKMFTHRPDCFGFLGIARELAGIQNIPFKSPPWYIAKPEFPDLEAEALPLHFNNELPNLVPRFTAITLSNIEVKASPLWLQIELNKLGQKSINNIVDYTNFYMLETGQPLHAYDYDKVKALSSGEATIVVRSPKPGEKLKLLNGKEIEPRAEAIMIATDKQLIGVGGVMGGSQTEVDDSTKNIILECANFDMYSVRRTSMAHGLFTEAVTRFTKGQSPLQNLAVLAKIVDEIRQQAGGKVSSPLLDDNHVGEATLSRGSLHPPVKLTADFINSRLGLKLSADEMRTLLINVEFEVEINDELLVKAPFWRTDIELREDVVEEIGRLYGYDKLPLELPKRDLAPAKQDAMLALKAKIRAQLAKAGANEVLTYSFVHGDLLKKVGQNPDQAFQVANALSPELQYYRLSLTPSLLDKVHTNIKAGYDQFALFELGKAHIHGVPDALEPDLPKEVNNLCLVFAADDKVAKRKYSGTAYYQARQYLLDILSAFGASGLLSLELLQSADLYKNPWLEQMTAPFEPARSAILRASDGLVWGVVGEYKASVRRVLKLPDFSAGFELDPLLLLNNDINNYVPLPRFPAVIQDITLRVKADLKYQDLFDNVWAAINEFKPEQTFAELGPVDIYQKEIDTKNITLRLQIASYERTLTDAEINELFDEVGASIKAKLGAERI
jgi:phenylalanyl-tRNA synthetase beta chain